ncbi:MAG TPA: molybdopterin-dependent oxidoreductase, partial [Acidocella sp.]|nr:molybdopterin-dependent oxidoreductase [Acidocella sp.]
TPMATRLDDVAVETFRAAPDDIARLGFAVLNQIDARAPVVEGIDEEAQGFAGRIAAALMAAAHPLVVCGCELGNEATLRAAFALAQMLGARGLGIALAVPECNSLGLALMQGGSVADALGAADGAVVIALENDLCRRAAPPAIDTLFERATVVALDHVITPTTMRADIVLPAANFAEAEGTLVSAEGRAQRFFPAVTPEGEIQPSWAWLRDIARACGRGPALDWEGFDDVTSALATTLPVFAGVPDVAPGHAFRVAGSRIRSAPHRYSGRTALDAGHNVHEPKPPAMNDTPFSATMEGYYGPMPAALVPFFWAPGWNSGQSLHKFQDETGAMRGGDPGVRLLEWSPASVMSFSDGFPAAFVRAPGRWLVVPHMEIFGSEELSALAPAIAERAAPLALYLNEGDAESLGVVEGDMVEAVFSGETHRRAVRLTPELAPGIAGMNGPGLAGWAALRPVQGTGGERCT